MKFADTEGLRSFYAAYFNSSGQVVRFDKLSLVRVAKSSQEFPLTVAKIPGMVIYCEVIRDSVTNEPKPGKSIEYRNTEHLKEFFMGMVDTSGSCCHVTLIRKEITFSDTYEYWANGNLWKRSMTGVNKSPVVQYYDEDGHLIPVPMNGPLVTTNVDS